MSFTYVSVRCPECKHVEEVLDFPENISEGLYTIPEHYIYECGMCRFEFLEGHVLVVVEVAA